MHIIDCDPKKIPKGVMELNPYGTLPTLVDRDVVLYSPEVLLDYLEDRFPHPQLLPVIPAERANIRLGLYRIKVDWFDKIDAMLITKSEKKRKDIQNEVQKSLAALPQYFGNHEYFMSDSFSIIDIYMTVLLWRLKSWKIKLPVTKKNNLNNYMQKMFTRSSFIRSCSKSERALQRN